MGINGSNACPLSDPCLIVWILSQSQYFFWDIINIIDLSLGCPMFENFRLPHKREFLVFSSLFLSLSKHNHDKTNQMIWLRSAWVSPQTLQILFMHSVLIMGLCLLIGLKDNFFSLKLWIFFIQFQHNFGCSKEPSHQDGSFKYPHYICFA